MNVDSPIKVGGLTIRYLVDGSQAGGIGMFELEVPPGSNVPPPHSHTHNEECVYVVEGTLRYTVDNVTRAYHDLRLVIVGGQLPPGSRISERILAQRLGLSRTPVRSALHRLEQEGWVMRTKAQPAIM